MDKAIEAAVADEIAEVMERYPNDYTPTDLARAAIAAYQTARGEARDAERLDWIEKCCDVFLRTPTSPYDVERERLRATIDRLMGDAFVELVEAYNEVEKERDA